MWPCGGTKDATDWLVHLPLFSLPFSPVFSDLWDWGTELASQLHPHDKGKKKKRGLMVWYVFLLKNGDDTF